MNPPCQLLVSRLLFGVVQMKIEDYNRRKIHGEPPKIRRIRKKRTRRFNRGLDKPLGRILIDDITRKKIWDIESNQW